MLTPEPHRRYVEIVLSVSTGQGRGCRGAAAREQVRAVELGPSLGDARGRLTPLRYGVYSGRVKRSLHVRA